MSMRCLRDVSWWLLAACMPLAACAAPASTAVQGLIGDAACDSDAQCRTIAVGAKACGGPEAYLAWSVLRTNPQRLQQAVDQENETRREAVRRGGEFSTCSVVPDPGAYCPMAVADAPRRCALRQHGAIGTPQTR
jgi:hypothetical protein